MKSRIHDLWRTLSVALLTTSLFAVTANAQSPEDAILDGDNGAAGLIEKRPTAKKVLDDPDPKALEALEKKRTAIESFINEFQEKFTKERELEVKLAKKLAKLAKQFDKLTNEALSSGDAFAEAHNPLLAEYRAALQEDRGPDVTKAAKAIAKVRNKRSKKLEKLNRRADKIKAGFDKLKPALDAAAAEGGEEEEPDGE